MANVSKTEVYHLTKIRTSSHTAIFVRDLRLDEKGMSDEVTVSTSYKPAPDLKLKRVILFNNSQFDSIVQNVPDVSSESFPNYNMAGINYASYPFKEIWFQNTNPSWKYAILKNIEFQQDYSLCRGYYGNVNVNFPNSSVLTSPTNVYNNINVNNYANPNYSNSGKLTLNKIITYEYQNEKVAPSIIFDYNKNNALAVYSNPDFYPRGADNWGYFKSDFSYGYSQYTNQVSKDYVKAWSLLKITDPLNGETEVEYESNTYNQVLDIESSTGYRGAAFIYRIKQVNDLGVNGSFGVSGSGSNGTFELVMEETNTTASPLSELSYLGSVSGVTKRVCVPFVNIIQTTSPLGSGNFNGFVSADIGSLQFNATNNNVINGALIAISSAVPRVAIFDPFASNNRVYKPNNNFFGIYPFLQNYTSTFNQALTYSGNGFVMFETPIGYEVYGSGVRVKRLKIKNTASEVYVKEYTYENGVATNEPDRFEYPRLKKGCSDYPAVYPSTIPTIIPPRYDFLQAKNYTQFDMNPYVGYSKVTVKDLGQINTANGKVETTFLTDPMYAASKFSSNFKINTFTHLNIVNPYQSTGIYSVTAINECTNVFNNIFGAMLESKVFDKNNNIITKTTNEYDITEQGATTEQFYFENQHYETNFNTPILNLYYAAYFNTVNIFRNKPIILKSSTSYGMGSFEKSETIARDEITGETTAMRSFGKNKSSSISYKTPAYKYYQPLEGLDFTKPKFRTILALGNDMYSYANIDSTITQTQANGTSASFLTAAYNLYSKNINQLQYSGATKSISQITLPYYFNNRSFVFDAGVGSMDKYGLLKKSNLNLNGLNLSALNSALYWEPATMSTYNWRLTKEVTLMDNYKNFVEVRDRNNRFSASRYGYKGYYKVSSVSNCNYASYTFADFENAPIVGNTIIDGDIVLNGNSLVVGGHTGSKSIQVTSNPAYYTANTLKSPASTLDLGLMSGRIYRASAWVNTSNLSKARINITVNGTIVSGGGSSGLSTSFSANSISNLVSTIGNWALLQIDFELPENLIIGTSDVFKIDLASSDGSAVVFDDFQFHPVESDFNANIYNPHNGRLIANIDANGFATKYTYDAAGTLLEVWKEIPSVGLKKIKSYTYNFARGLNN
jgi:hypothetical protein